jgi:hypothetical protein
MTEQADPIQVVVGKSIVAGFPVHDIHFISGHSAVRRTTRRGFPTPGSKPALFFAHKEGPASPETVSGEAFSAEAEPHLKGVKVKIHEGPHEGAYYMVNTPDGHTLVMNVSPKLAEKEAGAFYDYALTQGAQALGFIPPAPASPGFQLTTAPPYVPQETPRSALADAARAFMTATAGGAGAAAGWTAGKALMDFFGLAPKTASEGEIGAEEHVPEPTLDRPSFSARKAHGTVETDMGRLPSDMPTLKY